jgi:hypothetical protein
MPVLAVFRWEGDPDALVAAYDRELQHSVPREQPRRLSHIFARGDNEVVIVDLSETEAGLRSRPSRSTRCMRASRKEKRL